MIKKSTEEKKQSENDIILEALEGANKILKELYTFCRQQRNNALNNKPVKFIGLDDIDDIMLAGHEVEGAIDILKAKKPKSSRKRSSPVAQAGA